MANARVSARRAALLRWMRARRVALHTTLIAHFRSERNSIVRGDLNALLTAGSVSRVEREDGYHWRAL